MANNNEIDPLLTLELSGVKTYESQEEAWGARLYEWLNTYQGEVYGDPSWGNVLPQFKHEPTNLSHVQIAVEAMLLQKLTDRKSTRLNSSHVSISYAVFCLKKKNEP